MLYLLQLVQTLKFEVLLKSKQDSSPSVEDISSSLTSNTQTASSAAAAAGIVASGAPSTSSNTSSNNNTTNNGSTTSNATNPNSSRISSSRKNSLSSSLNSSKNLGKSTEKSMLDDSPLTEFLLERAIKNPILGNNFYWYLMVECEDKNKSIGRMYARVAFQFMSAMVEVPDGFHRRDMLRRQGELVETLHRLSKGVRSIKEGVAKRVSGSVREKGSAPYSHPFLSPLYRLNICRLRLQTLKMDFSLFLLFHYLLIRVFMSLAWFLKKQPSSRAIYRR